MIISASYRTDIPAFYGEWFARRRQAGYCLVRNPYSGQPYRVSLRPEDVDGYVFWTKNLAPFLPQLRVLRGEGCPFVVQYTINGYPRELERAVTDWRRAADHLRWLADECGPRAGVWRYDTVLLTSHTPYDWHLRNFDAISRALEGHVDEAVLSFAHFYRKTRRNLEWAARAQGFVWSDPDVESKRRLLVDLTAIAQSRGQRVTVCAQPETGGVPARCIDAARLSDVAGRAIRARQKGNRPGCECAEARDIGAYETCPHGCVYCYAVGTAARARRHWRDHDPAAEIL
jgi:hypothetical protein